MARNRKLTLSASLCSPLVLSLPFRRKSVAPLAAATTAGSTGRASGGGSEPPAQLPSTSGRSASEQQNGSAAVGDHVHYAEVYRQAALRAKQAEQASFVRRLKGCVPCLAWRPQAVAAVWLAPSTGCLAIPLLSPCWEEATLHDTHTSVQPWALSHAPLGLPVQARLALLPPAGHDLGLVHARALGDAALDGNARLLLLARRLRLLPEPQQHVQHHAGSGAQGNRRARCVASTALNHEWTGRHCWTPWLAPSPRFLPLRTSQDWFSTLVVALPSTPHSAGARLLALIR